MIIKKYTVNYTLDVITKFLNPAMIFNKHLGVKGDLNELFNRQDKRFLELYTSVTDLIEETKTRGIFNPAALYGIYKPSVKENAIIINNGKKDFVFDFPRQAAGEKLCLADFAAGPLPVFVCTVGNKFLQYSKELTIDGQYAKGHLVNVLGMCYAEACAECLHFDIRHKLGLDKDKNFTTKELFAQKYTGKRFSFGYAACPDLSMQKTLFGLLDPSEIGVKLTESFMMDPEASISGLIFINPKAKHFSVEEE